MSIASNLAEVKAAIGSACAEAGRDPATVRLLPISKTHPTDLIRQAMAAGYHQFGENRVQEMMAKAAELGDDVSWVLVGHLQHNKAALACSVMSELQSLDSLALAASLEKALVKTDRTLDVLIEVNSSAEASKFGLAPDSVLAFTADLVRFPHLQARGLMTVAHPDPALADKGFSRMEQLQADLRERDGGGWDELSMGMSGDFPAAIRHGSTCVRIGTAIFGARTYPVG